MLDKTRQDWSSQATSLSIESRAFINGRYEDAIRRLQEASDLREKSEPLRKTKPYEWYFLAMAHFRLRHTENAKQWLFKAVEWTENEDHELRWHQREALKLFRREAEELISTTSSPRPPVEAVKQ